MERVRLQANVPTEKNDTKRCTQDKKNNEILKEQLDMEDLHQSKCS